MRERDVDRGEKSDPVSYDGINTAMTHQEEKKTESLTSKRDDSSTQNDESKKRIRKVRRVAETRRPRGPTHQTSSETAIKTSVPVGIIHRIDASGCNK